MNVFQEQSLKSKWMPCVGSSLESHQTHPGFQGDLCIRVTSPRGGNEMERVRLPAKSPRVLIVYAPVIVGCYSFTFDYYICSFLIAFEYFCH